MEPDAGKQLYSVNFCANAAGKYISPYIIYRAKGNLWDTWLSGGPDNAKYTCNESGWMTGDFFTKWFHDIFLPETNNISKGEPRLLIYDGLNSHISYEVARSAVDHNVHLLVLPPHSSHALQPLDVGVFKSTKTCWSTTCLLHYEKFPWVSVGKAVFPSLLRPVFGHMENHPEHVVSGFRACGYYPFNRHAVDHKLIGEGERIAQGSRSSEQPPSGVQRETSEEMHHRLLRESVVEYCKSQMPEARPPTQRRRKVKHQYGDILTEADRVEQLRIEGEESAARARAGRGRGRGWGRGRG